MKPQNSITCIHCSMNLKDEHDQPCPNCGEIGKYFNVGISDEMTSNDDCKVSARNTNTNRSVVHSDSLNPTDTCKIEKYIRATVNSPDSYELRDYIHSLVMSFDSRLEEQFTVFYRGVDISVKDHLKTSQIGPSPNAHHGRYNGEGESCLYLTDNQEFIFNELGSNYILIQEYKLPTKQFKIADISPDNKKIHNNLALVFDVAERGATSSGYKFEEALEQKNMSKYFISQLIASCFKMHGWEGMYFPGVHGKNGTTYRNLVILGDIVNQWKSWAKGNYFPKTKTQQ